MKQPSRLVLSAVLAITAHIGLLFNAGQAVTNTDANQISTVMQFNLFSVAQAEPITPKQVQAVEPVKSALKPSPVMKKKSRKPEIKKPVITKTAVEEPIKIKKRDDSIQLEKSVKPTPSARTQPNKIKVTSVVRDKNVVFLQEPRFKSLPPAPVYPRQARLRGQQGTALIHARLNAKGEVIKTRMAKSSGFSLLDKAALKAIHGWGFMPGVDARGNKQVWVEVPVQFILNPKKVS